MEVKVPLGFLVSHSIVDGTEATKYAHSRRRPVASPGAGHIDQRKHLIELVAGKNFTRLRMFLRDTSQAR